jgi:glycosyltransferase involved in cell wall biosynthesis
MRPIEITAVINGHSESLMAVSSLRSMAAAAEYAGKQGINVELLAVLDRPDPLTAEVFEQFASRHPQLRVVAVDLGDVGYARNYGAQNASGKWTSFLDADDIWGEDWLYAAYQAAESDAREIVWHPDINVLFGATPHIYEHMDMDDPLFDPALLAFTNPWTSLSFVRTEFVRRLAYTGTHLNQHIGYEDWSWNIDAIDNGAIHKVVPNTAHAIRTKHVSLVKRTTAAGCINRPHDFLRRKILEKAQS